MMKAHFTLIFALLLICTGASVARAAGTPDHMPPSLETVCDMEHGAAYGHCNAYCEAMDCDLANDGDPSTQPHASATACAKVRAKFQQTTGRDVPCEVTCPCADPAVSPAFAGVLAGQVSFNRCDINGGGTQLVYESDTSYPIGVAFSFPFDGWFCGPAGDFGLPITEAQGEYCAQLLQQAANSQNVTCN